VERQRAEEIAASPDMANVSYKGEAIYIQQVDVESDTARIYPLDNPENEQSVSLAELSEDYR